MGRPYEKELRELDQTARWANALSIAPLEAFVQESATLPLIAIGSGGSSTAAHFASLLHRERHQQFARHATPLEILTNEPGLGASAVLLASASGRNRDVLAALGACLRAEVPALATLTTRRPSPLAETATPYCHARVLEGDLPSGKDGFLATNSLLATLLLLCRAYGYAPALKVGDLGKELKGGHDKPTVVILHGGWASPVATDLESKLNESALAAALVADYRNFGHGRHLWLAKRSEETLVVALITPDVEELARRTLALLPRSTAILRLASTSSGPSGTLDLFVQGLAFIGAFGRSKMIDPGRPSVPPFGRKIYALDARITPAGRSAIDRKERQAPVRSVAVRKVYQQGLARFLEVLSTSSIGAIVLDYDGTLCSSTERARPLRSAIKTQLVRAVRSGLLVGIATGRGDSVRDALRAAMPKSLWKQVLVGYHNGAELGELGDDTIPNVDGVPPSPLAELLALLKRDPILVELTDISPSSDQLSIRPRSGLKLDPAALMSHVLALATGVANIRIVASTHSVDVITARTTKLAVVQALAARIKPPAQVLSIGDRGAWPGNDFELLSGSLSLSVDEASSVSDRCWNLAPPGVTGPAATLFFLTRLQFRQGVGHFDTKGL